MENGRKIQLPILPVFIPSNTRGFIINIFSGKAAVNKTPVNHY